WPEPSVVTLRVFSIRAGLEASTVTPGSTAPDVSLTVPAMDAWPKADAGSNTATTAITSNPGINRRIVTPLESITRTGTVLRLRRLCFDLFARPDYCHSHDSGQAIS